MPLPQPAWTALVVLVAVFIGSHLGPAGPWALAQTQDAACSVSAARPPDEPLWYALVDTQPVYNGTVPAGSPTTFVCATDPLASVNLTCNPNTLQWPPEKFPYCDNCSVSPVLNFSVSPWLNRYPVLGLRNGDTRVIQWTDRAPCPPPVFEGFMPPGSRNPIPSKDAEEAGTSYAFTVFGDSRQPRWITASTCGHMSINDTMLRVRLGCNSYSKPVASNDDFCRSQSQVSFLADPGQTYTVYLSLGNSQCFLYPNITLSAAAGSDMNLFKQSYLISPKALPALCWTPVGYGASFNLESCNPTDLKQHLQMKDVGNGNVFLRPTRWNETRVLAVNMTTAPPFLTLANEPTVFTATPILDYGLFPPPSDKAQFTVTQQSDGSYRIRHPNTSSCVTLTAKGIEMLPCSNTNADQNFLLTKPTGATPSALLGQSGQVQSQQAQGLCWTASDQEGGDVTLDDCDKTNKNQVFQIKDAGNGFAQLLVQGNARTQRAVAVDSTNLNDGSGLILSSVNTTLPQQLWSILRNSSGVYRAVNALTSLCIANTGNSVGAALQQNVCGQDRRFQSLQNFQIGVFLPPAPPPVPPAPSQPAPVPAATAPPPSASPPPVVTPPPPPPATPPDLLEQMPQGDPPLSKGAIAAAVVAPVVAVLLGGCLIVWCAARRRRNESKQTTTSKDLILLHNAASSDLSKDQGRVSRELPVSDTAAVRQKLHVKGLVKGEPFLRGAAPHYTWTDLVPGAGVTAVEEGINAEQLDQLSVSEESRGEGESGDVGSSPVVKLTGAEVAQQIQLLKEGLLGRGATALVFQCRWPSRFGPHALLAAKVLRDPFEDNSEHLQAFMYEARVLEDLRHPNIVRLYGYCLEPPTVCLIMELLPNSLKKVLADSSHHTSLQSSSTPQVGTLLHPTPPHSTLQQGPVRPHATSITSSATSNLSHAASTASTTQTPPASAAQIAILIPGSAPESVRGSAVNGTPLMHGPLHSTPSADGPGDNSSGFTTAHTTTSTQHRSTGRQVLQPATTDHHLISPDPHPAHPIPGQHRAPNGSLTVHITPVLSPTTQLSPLGTLNSVDIPSSASRLPSSDARSGSGPVTLSAPRLQPHTGAAAVSTQHQDSALYNRQQTNPSRTSLGDRSSHHHQATSAAKLSMHDVLHISADVACGLAFLHQKPAPALDSVLSSASSSGTGESAKQAAAKDGLSMIVHRDLKPDNVLLNSRGVAKISDFGLARVHDSTTIYSVHMAVGTLRYMAPELLDCDTPKSMTDKVDLYSLGMLMWEMVTGEPPWKGLTDPQIMTAVQMKKRPSMSAHSAPSAANSSQSLVQPRTTPDATRHSLAVALATVNGLPSVSVPRHAGERRSDGALSVGQQLQAVGVERTSAPSSGSTLGSALSTQQSGTHVSGPGSSVGVAMASFDAVPQFKTLISSCWQHNSLRRPTAKAVHRVLLGLVKQQEQQQQQPQSMMT